MTMAAVEKRTFTASVRSAQQGFTLIELLVALSIFALLSAAGVLLLGNAVSAQGQVAHRLEEQGGMLRVVSLLDQDMAQALPRISRTEGGLLAPAFYSRLPSNSEPMLHFVRGGWTNPGNAARPDVQKVEYWLRDHRLERRSYPLVDGAAGDDPAMLIDGVDSIELAFRDASGAWTEQWQSEKPLAIPVAMRIVITRRGAPPLTMLFRVGSGEAGHDGEGGLDDAA